MCHVSPELGPGSSQTYLEYLDAAPAAAVTSLLPVFYIVPDVAPYTRHTLQCNQKC